MPAGRPIFENHDDVRTVVARMSKNEILIISAILGDIDREAFGFNEWNRSRVIELQDRYATLCEKVDKCNV